MPPLSPETRSFHLRDASGVQQLMLQMDPDSGSSFFPRGFIDLLDLESDPGDPPSGRIRLKLVGSTLSLVDSAGEDVAAQLDGGHVTGMSFDTILTNQDGDVLVNEDGNVLASG